MYLPNTALLSRCLSEYRPDTLCGLAWKSIPNQSRRDTAATGFRTRLLSTRSPSAVHPYTIHASMSEWVTNTELTILSVRTTTNPQDHRAERFQHVLERQLDNTFPLSTAEHRHHHPLVVSNSDHIANWCHAPPHPHASLKLRIPGPEYSRLRVGACHSDSEAPFWPNLRLEVSHAGPANAKPLSISVRCHLYRWKCERRRGPGRTRRSIVRLKRAAVGRVKRSTSPHSAPGRWSSDTSSLISIDPSASVASCAALPLCNADCFGVSPADVALGSP
ncbi:hypothetical protein C8Q70DRAFT_643306 [Cubamyces menziesii]|nr:hypothetical protein C8Q70DRAFT_643306 [Cubamyces menziesii]